MKSDGRMRKIIGTIILVGSLFAFSSSSLKYAPRALSAWDSITAPIDEPCSTARDTAAANMLTWGTSTLLARLPSASGSV